MESVCVPFSNWPCTSIEGWVAIGTIALAAVTALLWWSTSRLVRETKLNGERQLRAWVGMSALSRSGFGRGDTVKFVAELQNFGQTPASKVEVDYGIALSGTPDDDVVVIALNVVVPPINPGEHVSVVLSDLYKVTLEDIPNLDAGLTHTLLAGTVKYRDIFGRRRATNFRAFATGRAQTTGIKWLREGNDQR